MAPLHPAAFGNFMLATIAISSAVLGFAVCCVAVRIYVRMLNERQRARVERANAKAAIALRDAVLAASEERAIILGDGETFSARGADVQFRDAMSGPDAKVAAVAVDNLLKKDAPFRIVARGPDGGAIAVRGARVDHRPALFVKRLGAADLALDYRSLLDAVPVPVWLRGADRKLRWGNRAFLNAVGASSLRTAISTDVSLEKSEIDLVTAVRDGAKSMEATRYALIDGRRRALSINLTALDDSTIAGIAVDITELTQAEARVQLNADATSDMLNGMTLGVAVFDKDLILTDYNTAFAGLWSMPEQWLDGRPVLGTILDRLRETRRLPEQQSYRVWKAEQLGIAESCNEAIDDLWHLPDGRSVRIRTRPHLLGGISMTFEDVSESLRLEASLKLLTQVQRATLDTVDDGIAVFGPDGRLVLHNKVFARQWLLAEDELKDQPSLAKVARLAEQRLGPDGLWRIVSAGVTSEEPERCNEWGKATRSDGRIIALAMSRLPNGATAVTFSDLTDVERFHTANLEPAHVAA